MSQETLEWLNNYTLIGYTEKRGTAWHYRQGADNHYPGAIPLDDVLTRLFNFTVDEAPLYVSTGDDEGPFVLVEGRKAMRCSDNGDILGIFKEGYEGHQYEEWLLSNVATILGDSKGELGIGSAGLLKNRGQAWVSVEVPENVETPEGVQFRPNLLACTSFDGSLATTYKRIIGVVVCDNTMAAALSEDGQQYKVKHSKYSRMKLQDAKDALAVMHTMADDFTAEISRLCSWEVSEKAYEKLLDLVVPMPVDKDAPKHSATVAEKKREAITVLYRQDDRCAPWRGTAFGVLQAFNTYGQHMTQVRKGAPRIVRNMENAVTDKIQAADQEILAALTQVTKGSAKATNRTKAATHMRPTKVAA